MTARRARTLGRPVALTGAGARFAPLSPKTARPARNAHGVNFLELPKRGDREPVVVAEVAGHRVSWSAAEVHWIHEGCTERPRPHERACSHALAVARALPVDVALTLVSALVVAGQGTQTNRQRALL